MDEPWLRELLDRAIASEPPPRGPVAANSLLAGTRLHRRRWVQGTAACAAAAAVIGTAALAVTGAAGRTSGRADKGDTSFDRLRAELTRHADADPERHERARQADPGRGRAGIWR